MHRLKVKIQKEIKEEKKLHDKVEFSIMDI